MQSREVLSNTNGIVCPYIFVQMITLLIKQQKKRTNKLTLYFRIFDHVEKTPVQSGGGGLSSCHEQIHCTHAQVLYVKSSITVLFKLKMKEINL